MSASRGGNVTIVGNNYYYIYIQKDGTLSQICNKRKIILPKKLLSSNRFHYLTIELISQCSEETNIIGKHAKCVLSILMHDQRSNLLDIKYGYIHVNLEKGVAYR